jgi:hypothetical protein
MRARTPLSNLDRRIDTLVNWPHSRALEPTLPPRLLAVLKPCGSIGQLRARGRAIAQPTSTILTQRAGSHCLPMVLSGSLVFEICTRYRAASRRCLRTLARAPPRQVRRAMPPAFPSSGGAAPDARARLNLWARALRVYDSPFALKHFINAVTLSSIFRSASSGIAKSRSSTCQYSIREAHCGNFRSIIGKCSARLSATTRSALSRSPRASGSGDRSPAYSRSTPRARRPLHTCGEIGPTFWTFNSRPREIACRPSRSRRALLLNSSSAKRLR